MAIIAPKSGPEAAPNAEAGQAGNMGVPGGEVVGVDKIRDLLFGNQMQDYDRRFAKLEERFLQRFKDVESGKTLVFLSNNFALPALTIAHLYKNRWQVELFFKWIKQHLRIKKFFGTSENAVKTQIWIAVSVYVLVAIVKKRLGLEASLYTLLQIFSVTLFEKIPIEQALNLGENRYDGEVLANQLNLFAF